MFNALVLGAEIDLSLPFAYVGAFAALLFMQWALQNPIARTYLENQRMNNRVTAQGYTAWDNIFSGNGYNLRLWLSGFKTRLREALTARIRAIVAREGMSAMSGIVSLTIVFATTSVVAVHNAGNMALLIALATTLPRQIEMTYELHLLASGWNDFISIWARFAGVAANMLPQPAATFDERIKFDRLVLREGEHANVVSSVNDALRIVAAQPTGRINIRGANGTGKSSLLASLKTEMRRRAFYWPPSDRLAFKFAGGVVPVEVEEGHDGESIMVAELDGQEARILHWRAPAQVARGNRQRDRRPGLSARRMGRQPRCGEQGQGGRAGRALAARARVVEIRTATRG